MRAASGGVCPQGPSHGAQCEEWGAPRENDLQGQGWLGPLCSAGKAWGRGEVWAPLVPSNQTPKTPWAPQELASPTAGLVGTDGAHLISDALSVTGALCIHPQVGAELVGAHPRVAPRPRRQAGPHSQPSQEQQRQERPQGLHEDSRPTGWGVWPLAPPQTLLSPTPCRHPPSQTCNRCPCCLPWAPLCPGQSPQQTLASDWVEQSLCMWHRPLPRQAPLVSTGQGAGRREEGWGGAGAQEQRHWRQGSPRGGEGRLWPEMGGGTAVTGAPPPSRPWDQSCPAGGGRAGQPLPQSRPPPGNDCVPAELQGLCIQPRHPGVLLPSQRSPFPCSFPQACWRGAFEAQMYQVGGVPWACSGGQWLVEGGS